MEREGIAETGSGIGEVVPGSGEKREDWKDGCRRRRSSSSVVPPPIRYLVLSFPSEVEGGCKEKEERS